MIYLEFESMDLGVKWMKKGSKCGGILALLLALPGLAFAAGVPTRVENQPVPAGVEENLQRLVDLQLVQLPAGCPSVSAGHFTRDELTDLTLQAMSRLGMDAHGDVGGVKEPQSPGARETQALRKALYKDLQNRGMLEDKKVLTDLSPSPYATDEKKNEDQKYKLTAELRYNYVKHSGDPRWNWRDSRLRARLYLEAKINDNWHAFGMAEFNHHFLGHHNDDSWMEDKRIYVRGMVKGAAVTAGMYGLELGEGNIFDSTVKGATVDWGNDLRYEATVGRTKAGGDLASFGAVRETDTATMGAAIHSFGSDDWGNEKSTIWDAFYNRQLSPLVQGGLMLLGSDKAQGDGKRNGFVAKAQLGDLHSWEPCSQAFALRYYYQPASTYVAHTMAGLADYMTGFKGWGAQYQYTIMPNMVLNLEYYNLRELSSGKPGRTLWGDVTYYFG